MDVLIELAKRLPKEELGILVVTARETDDGMFHIRLLSTLALRMPEMVDEALALVSNIKGRMDRVDMLTKLAQRIPEATIEALTHVRGQEIGEERFYTHILVALAHYLPEVMGEATTDSAQDSKPSSPRIHAGSGGPIPARSGT
ncbi:MAG: hypothetical protein QM706_17985 [Nitrospira sp.]